jgi:hemin uptake protein HemP
MEDVPAVPPLAEAIIEERTGARGKVLSRELLGDRGELIIEHAGREYRLRVTQNGKLILTA